MTTGLAMVRESFPRADLDLADLLLWEYTCWPFDMEETRRQLRDLGARSHGKKRGWRRRLGRVMRFELDQMETAMRALAAHDGSR